MMKRRVHFCLIFAVLLFTADSRLLAQGNQVLTFQDIMKFKAIQNPVISENGKWVAYATKPDRGDGEVNIHSTDGNTLYTIERGSRPQLTADGRAWLCSISAMETPRFWKIFRVLRSQATQNGSHLNLFPILKSLTLKKREKKLRKKIMWEVI